MPKPELFDPNRYPNLRRHAETSRGPTELIEVNETSDGFLIGTAKIGEGNDAYHHSIFLGAVSDFR